MKKNEIMNTKGNNLLNDAQKIIETSQKYAFRAVNVALIRRNWLLGKRIAEEELQGKGRAEYGAEIIKELSLELTRIYGNGFDFSSLYKYLDFYKAFPNIFHTVSGKSNNSIIDTESLNSDDNKMSLTIENKDVIILDTVCPKSETTILDTGSPNSDDNKMSLTIDISEDTILDTVCPKSFSLLTWSHYRTLLQVKDPDARDWYMKEAADQTWSVRTLQRNISSQYYFRLLKSQKKDLVKKEMLEKTAEFQKDNLALFKSPVIVEFLGLSQNSDFTETQLEKSIISNLQKFMMELGRGFAFVARQQHIKTEKHDYYVDLVFYNYILKCFIIIDLKTSKITHQDVGQMDMYIRMYDELKRTEGDNPTLGIILCADTDEDIARYSILKGNEQLFASKYKTYLPSEDELRAEIETQKRLFYLQQLENQ